MASGLVAAQPPLMRRRNSTMPASNSWLPKELTSSPMSFSTSIVDSWRKSEETSGEAPTRSPPAIITL